MFRLNVLSEHGLHTTPPVSAPCPSVTCTVSGGHGRVDVAGASAPDPMAHDSMSRDSLGVTPAVNRVITRILVFTLFRRVKRGVYDVLKTGISQSVHFPGS